MRFHKKYESYDALIESIFRKILSTVLSSKQVLLDAVYKVELNDFLSPLWVPRILLTSGTHRSPR